MKKMIVGVLFFVMSVSTYAQASGGQITRKPKTQVTKKDDSKREAKAQAKSDQAKYDAMDVRVRLGAYKIVGTDKTVIVREGDDLSKISRRCLGPDMECYVEVYNNIKSSTPLEVGQEIKIPKLEFRKK